MDKQKASEDIQFIKEILNKTQQDISKTGNFFLWVGVVNLLGVVMKEIGYCLLNLVNEIPLVFWQLLRSVDVISFFLLVIVFVIYYRKLSKVGNDLSKSILKIWGTLLIGGRIFIKILSELYSNAHDNLPPNAVMAMEKVIFFLLIAVGYLFMSILVHDKKICASIIACVVIYCFLLFMNSMLTVGHIHGHGVQMYVHDIFISAILSVGMIASGVYIRCRRIKSSGDQQYT